MPTKGVISTEVAVPETRHYVLEELAEAGIRIRRSVSAWLN